MSTLLLARAHFALCISFHYLFVPFSLGIGVLLVATSGLYLKTKVFVYESLTRFLVSIFSVFFAVGVATGLVQVFGFGTNWVNFSSFVGDIFGSLLGAEGIFAFFLESIFVGILILGWNKLSPKMRFFSTIMVALGAHLSAFWIVAANSWMQTPAGYKLIMKAGKKTLLLDNFWEVLNNPSMWTRFFHTVIGAWIAGSFFLLSVSSYYLFKKKHVDLAKKGLKLGLVLSSIFLVLQLISADISARNVARNQPIKFAAFEGIYQTKERTPLWVVGAPLSKKKKVIGIPLPGFLSFLIYKNFKTPVKGLDQFDEKLWPNVHVVFQFYHIMVLAWGILATLVLLGWKAFVKVKKNEKVKGFLKVALISLIISPIVSIMANESGWFAAEVGRQPWVVQGLMKTEEALSSVVSRGQIITSLILLSLVFLLLFIVFLTVLLKKIQSGPIQDNNKLNKDL